MIINNCNYIKAIRGCTQLCCIPYNIIIIKAKSITHSLCWAAKNMENVLHMLKRVPEEWGVCDGSW